MQTIPQHCPLCKSGQFNLYLQSKDFSVSKEIFSILKCSNCAFAITDPKPAGEELARYYESENYISHTDEANNVVNSLYKLARVFTIRDKSALLKKWAEKGKLLDIGCGTGDFLFNNQKNGWITEGVEVNNKAREIAEAKLKKNLFTSLNGVEKDKTYNAITLWHVLEHIEELEQTCLQISEHLEQKGTLITAVPNYESFDAQYYKEYWAAYDLPRHLYHFSKKSMELLWLKYGMEVKAVIPMKLDAFYVSMLSEKYKSGKVNLLKAAYIATKSNFKAQQTINYSSLIYILRKK